MAPKNDYYNDVQQNGQLKINKYSENDMQIILFINYFGKFFVKKR